MDVFDQRWWDEQYASAPALFSGEANAQLVAEVAALPPGRALDAGCGEGGDAIWLAEHGWGVVAVDISPVALGRAAAEARRRGLADRIRFEQADLTTWTPSGSYDLVTSSYLHPAGAARTSVYATLAELVAPGGTLLIVLHDPSEAAATHPDLADRLATPSEVAAALDPAQWDVVTATTRSRRTRHGDHGDHSERTDAVVVARRR